MTEHADTHGRRARTKPMADRRKGGPKAEGPDVFRTDGTSYLDVPSRDPRESAVFFRSVFGWTVEERPAAWSFVDGSGHFIGHFVSNRSPSGKDGIRPYIHVAEVDRSLRKVQAARG